MSFQWRHNGRDCVSNHQPDHCFLIRLFWRRSKKALKLHASGLCAGNSPVTGEFYVQIASNAENVSIWWRHHVEKSRPWDSSETSKNNMHWPLYAAQSCVKYCHVIVPILYIGCWQPHLHIFSYCFNIACFIIPIAVSSGKLPMPPWVTPYHPVTSLLCGKCDSFSSVNRRFSNNHRVLVCICRRQQRILLLT